MKYFILLCMFYMGSISLSAQTNPSQIENNFNFWIGNWNATWSEGDSLSGNGTNLIEAVLDGKVIRESFEILEGKSKGFKGTSISVYQPKFKTWKQAWADNQGGYIDFTGDMDGDKRIFKTQIIINDDKQLTSRMVFYDILENSFTWDWESSQDGGKNWKLNWRIYYSRVK